MAFILCRINLFGGTSYLAFPKDHKSIKSTTNTKDIYFSIWCFFTSLVCYKNRSFFYSQLSEHFIGIKIDGVNIEKAVKAKDIHKLEKWKNISAHFFELEGKNSTLSIFLPIHKSKNENCVSKDTFIDMLLCRNPYGFIKKFHTFIGTKDKQHLRRKCYTSFLTEDVLKTPKDMLEKNLAF